MNFLIKNGAGIQRAAKAAVQLFYDKLPANRQREEGVHRTYLGYQPKDAAVLVFFYPKDRNDKRDGRRFRLGFRKMLGKQGDLGTVGRA